MIYSRIHENVLIHCWCWWCYHCWCWWWLMWGYYRVDKESAPSTADKGQNLPFTFSSVCILKLHSAHNHLRRDDCGNFTSINQIHLLDNSGNWFDICKVIQKHPSPLSWPKLRYNRYNYHVIAHSFWKTAIRLNHDYHDH